MSTTQTTTQNDITQRTDSGYFQGQFGNKATGWPEDTNSWQHLISSTHDNAGNYYAMQMAGSFFDNDHFFVRKTNGNGAAGWRELFHTGNLDPSKLAPKRNPSFEESITLENGLKLKTNGNLTLEAVYDYGSAQSKASRFQISRPAYDVDTYADLEFFKDLRGRPNPANTNGGTSHVIKIKEYVGDSEYHQWPVHVDMEFSGTGGQHVGVYAVMQKHVGAQTTSWAFCGENRDFTPNPVTGLVGMEMGMGGRGLDPRELRCAIDISTDGALPWDEGRNEIGVGLRIGPGQNLPNWTQGVDYGTPDGVATHTGYVVVKKGVELKGNMITPIDMSTVYSEQNTAMAMSSGLQFKWNGGGVLGFNDQGMILATPDLRAGTPTPAGVAVYVPALIPGYGRGLIAVFPDPRYP